MAAEARVFVTYSVILLMLLVQRCSFNLVVNIKAKDGDVVQKEFRADPEKDYVTIDFMTHGSRYITVFIDFRLVSFFPFLFESHLSISSCSSINWSGIWFKIREWYSKIVLHFIPDNWRVKLETTLERLYFMLQKFGFIKRVDKGWVNTVKDLESWRFERMPFVKVNRGIVGCCGFTWEFRGALPLVDPHGMDERHSFH